MASLKIQIPFIFAGLVSFLAQLYMSELLYVLTFTCINFQGVKKHQKHSTKISNPTTFTLHEPKRVILKVTTFNNYTYNFFWSLDRTELRVC